jgi:hypothetical protein
MVFPHKLPREIATMPCPDKKPVRSYLTAEEYAAIKKVAHSAGISVSHFIREVALGHQVKTFEHEEFKLELMKTRADLGRLGGLLKMALAQASLEKDCNPENLRGLLAEIWHCQNALKEAVTRL